MATEVGDAADFNECFDESMVPTPDSASTSDDDLVDENLLDVGHGSAELIAAFPSTPFSSPSCLGWLPVTLVTRFSRGWVETNGASENNSNEWALGLLALNERDICAQYRLEEERLCESMLSSGETFFAKLMDNLSHLPLLRPSTHWLTFADGDACVQPFVALETRVMLRNQSKHRARFRASLFLSEPALSSEACSFEFVPSSGMIRGGREQELVVVVRVTRADLTVRGVVLVEVEGGLRVPLLVSITTRTPKFGVVLSSLPTLAVRVNGSANDIAVAAILVQLREVFIASGGLLQEGVFQSNAAEPAVVRRAQELLEDGKFEHEHAVEFGPIVIACLIKKFLRELPKPLIGGEAILYALQQGSSRVECPACVVDGIAVAERSTLLFLVELLKDVVVNVATTMMDAKKCAVALGPSVFVASLEGDADDAIAASRSVVQLLEDLVTKAVAADEDGDESNCDVASR